MDAGDTESVSVVIDQNRDQVHQGEREDVEEDLTQADHTAQIKRENQEREAILQDQEVETQIKVAQSDQKTAERAAEIAEEERIEEFLKTAEKIESNQLIAEIEEVTQENQETQEDLETQEEASVKAPLLEIDPLDTHQSPTITETKKSDSLKSCLKTQTQSHQARHQVLKLTKRVKSGNLRDIFMNYSARINVS